MKLYKLCFVFAGKLIFLLYRQSTKELKYMKAKIKYNNNTFVTCHARRYLPAALFKLFMTSFKIKNIKNQMKQKLIKIFQFFFKY